MNSRIVRCWCASLLWLLWTPLGAFGAELSPTLTARQSGVALYARQDSESEPIATLAKDDPLSPMVESIGSEIWYMVRTKQGLIGWVRGVDVIASREAEEVFKERASATSTWSARTADGKTFSGTWSLTPDSSSKSAGGAWTLTGPGGATVMRGTWFAEKHATGWNGVWRATVEGRSGEHTGSWSAELAHVRNAPLTELFQAAVKQAVNGLWTGGHESGSWSIRASK